MSIPAPAQTYNKSVHRLEWVALDEEKRTQLCDPQTPITLTLIDEAANDTQNPNIVSVVVALEQEHGALATTAELDLQGLSLHDKLNLRQLLRTFHEKGYRLGADGDRFFLRPPGLLGGGKRKKGVSNSSSDSSHSGSKAESTTASCINQLQADSKRWTDQIISSISKTDVGGVWQAIIELNTMELEAIPNPLPLLQDLIKSAGGSHTDWTESGQKREIAKIMRRVAHLTYQKSKTEKRPINKLAKKQMLDLLENAIALVDEKTRLETGLHYELELVTEAVCLIPDTTKKFETLSNVGDLISRALFYKSAGAVAKLASMGYKNILKKIRKKWYEKVLYADFLVHEIKQLERANAKSKSKARKKAGEQRKRLVELLHLMQESSSNWHVLYGCIDALRVVADAVEDKKLQELAYYGIHAASSESSSSSLEGIRDYADFNKRKWKKSWRVRAGVLEAALWIENDTTKKIKTDIAELLEQRRKKIRHTSTSIILNV